MNFPLTIFYTLQIHNLFFKSLKVTSFKMLHDNCNNCGESLSQYKWCAQCVRKQENGNCESCDGSLSQFEWCVQCGRNQLIEGSSGNEEYDDIFKATQTDVDWHDYPCLKWIPEQQLENIMEIGKYEFGTLFSADWINGAYDGFQREESGSLVYKYKSKKCRVKIFNKD